MAILGRLALFVFLWVTVGFSAGTSLLLGPVRWASDRGRAAGWGSGLENAVVRGAIVVLVLASAAIAVWLTRAVLRSRWLHVRVGVPALTAAAAAAALGLWLTPGMAGTGTGEQTAAGSSFTFGPLPTKERMVQLRREGYTAIVSLLHPAVVPFEPELIAEGRAAAARAGLEYIHVPMLPWISDNGRAIARLRELARHGTGRYYVHCYLGQDRVRIARRVIEEAEPRARTTAIGPSPTLRAGLRFERGKVVEAAPGIWLTPCPTDDELMRYVLPSARRVVSLLDPADPDDAVWIDREARLLEANRVPFALRPLPAGELGDARLDAERVRQVAREVVAMPRPVVVHAFLSTDTGRSPAAEAFLEALRAEIAASRAAGPVDDGQGTPPPPPPAEAAPPPGDPPRALAGIVPGLRTVVLAGPWLVLLGVAAAAFAGWLRASRGVAAPYTRKTFHFLIFTTAGVLHLAAGLPVVSLFGAIVSLVVLYALWRGDDFPFYEAMARPTDAPRRRLFIFIPLATTAVGGMAAALLFGGFAYVGYLVAGWGDAVGEPVGTAFGRHRYRVPSLGRVPATRSLEGSMAVCLIGALAAFVGLVAGGVSPEPAAVVGLLCGVVGAGVEAFSNHGLDNLTVQLAAAGTAYLLLL